MISNGDKMDSKSAVTNLRHGFDMLLKSGGIAKVSERDIRKCLKSSDEFVSFTGLANVSADSATSVMVDTTMGADLTVFDWTMASKRGAL